MKRILLLSVVLFAGCSYFQKKETVPVVPAAKDVPKNTAVKVPAPLGETKFVPSGTEVEFHGTKKFTLTDNTIKIDIIPEKKCTLSVHIDKQPEVLISENTILTVVGYRAETNEVVMTDPTYHQYALSCMEKTTVKLPAATRATSSVAESWKKATIELEDLRKMEPMLKVKFVPM